MKTKELFRPRALTLLASVIALFLATSIGAEEGVVYAAFLSQRDHLNSNGERLTSVADILRQDRANFHKGGGDPGDEDDGGIFSTTEGRGKFEYFQIVLQNVSAGSIIRGTQRSIVVRVRGRKIFVEAVE